MCENLVNIRLREGLNGGKSLHPSLEERDHNRHLRLLEHDFAHPDPVGVRIRPPRHFTFFLIEPGKHVRVKRTHRTLFYRMRSSIHLPNPDEISRKSRLSSIHHFFLIDWNYSHY
jgi:hypothetical protein